MGRRGRSPRDGKSAAKNNAITLGVVIVGMCVYFTVQAMWSVVLVAAVVFLAAVLAFYLWIWIKL